MDEVDKALSILMRFYHRGRFGELMMKQLEHLDVLGVIAASILQDKKGNKENE